MDSPKKDDVVTMVDVLNDEKELDEATSAVLSGSDEKICTYSSGYIKRQALYSCLTCCPEAKDDQEKAIGLCLGCSLDCHDHHQLVELYTKRSFRCDCGLKYNSVACRLDTSKKKILETSASSSTANVNELNKYNQNFSGTYCTCHRPYPDEEDTVDDEMIQCIVCEDWYHTRHLNTKVPDSTTYTEMICESCVTKNDFLLDYIGLAVEVVDLSQSAADTTLNVTQTNDSIIEESSPKRIKLSDDACTRPNNPLNDNVAKALFFKDAWRKSLCQCEKCMKLYEEQKVQYLIDQEDTVVFYEEKGKNKPKTSSYDASLAALSSLDRVNQIDAITSYNRMKDKLFEFLQTFVVNNQIVTEEDVKRFFRTMKEGTDNQNVHQPHFCR
ncbi:hypothetical protein ACKWTF_000270 [Chironomus riparius]